MMINRTNTFRFIKALFVILIFVVLQVNALQPQSISITELSKNLQSPKDSKPYVWWHWINGNITKDGITKDLEWMKSVGIGGAVVFNVGTMDDKLSRAVPFNSDSWWAMVAHAEKECDRLGLEIGMHNCDGWSHSGGPWMTAEESMKELVSIEKNISATDSKITIAKPASKENFYRDIAVLALPVKHSTSFVTAVQLTSNYPNFKKEVLLDGNSKTDCVIGATSAKPIWFNFSYSELTDVASVSIRTGSKRFANFTVEIQTSNDSIRFETIDRFQSNSRGNIGWQANEPGQTMTLNFRKTTCKYFRVKFLEGARFSLSELYVGSTNRVKMWEAKAGQISYTEHGGAFECFSPDFDSWKNNDTNSVVKKVEIIDVTNSLKADNTLDWKPKSGTWKIVRIGYTSTGKTTGPSTVEGRGLEADKLNPKMLEKHYNAFVSKIIKNAKENNVKSLKYTEIDSWENGIQNWTDEFPAIFKARRGYDIKPFLPLIVSGQIIDSYEVSERFLWDFRRTISDLISEACFGKMADMARADGIKVYAEGAGRQQFLYNPINYSKNADIPKGEFWARFGEDGANLKDNTTMSPRIDCKVAASVAHIYGGQLAAAESFTGGSETYGQGPFDIKMLADKAFVMGVNHMVLHTSVHQPYTNLKPGFGLSFAGSHFTRNNIIYENGREWMLYLSRCQYLLRQGLFVADVCYFTGDNVPNYLGFRSELSVPLPEGYDYDGINSDIIINHMSVKNGKIVLSSGMEYSVLLLPNDLAMEPTILAKIEELVAAGATVVGTKPQMSHGLKDYQKVDSEVKAKADKIWGKCDGIKVKENSYGKGKIYWGSTFDEIFTKMDIIPDFQFSGDAKCMSINYIHRKTNDMDIYFVANSMYRPESIVAKFRITNKTPYFFYADNGKMQKVATFVSKNGITEIPINFASAGSVFVLFTNETPNVSVIDKNIGNAILSYNAENKLAAEFFTSGNNTFKMSDGTQNTVNVSVPSEINLEDKWNITFPITNKAPIILKNAKLFKWNESTNNDIKYFSGKAVYTSTFNISKEYLQKNNRFYIDLGKVRNLANIKVNGCLCAELWKEPFFANITEFVKEGSNILEIEIVNTWVNRMIGDEQLPSDIKYSNKQLVEFPDWVKDSTINRTSGRTTFTLRKFYDNESSLMDAGLFGPIRILSSVNMDFKKK